MRNRVDPFRVLDLTLITLIAPLWLPALTLSAFICFVTQGKPVLFTQTRIGLHGIPFTAYKLRTMMRDADRYLDDNGIPTINRVTPLGRLLRRTGLDEIPQLLNVAKGDMSLVGPRPILPEWLEQIPNGVDHPRFQVRPGLTGAAQVEGRNTVKWSRRLELDTEWATETKIASYIYILMRTPAALVRPTTSIDRNQSEVNDLGPERDEAA